MRKQVLSLITLFVALSLVMVTACKKSVTQKEESNNFEPIPISGKTTGQVHNDMLNLISSEPGFPNLTAEKSFVLLANHLQYSQPMIVGLEFANKFSQRISGGFKMNRTDLLGKYNTTLISELQSSNSASIFNQKSMGIELAISSDNELTHVQKVVYINTLSVLKNSFMYWEDALMNENHPWHSVLMKLKNNKVNNFSELVGGSCIQYFNPFDPLLFTTCLAVVDALNYEDAYWYIYNGSNHTYAHNQATAQGSYASGVAAGLGMAIN